MYIQLPNCPWALEKSKEKTIFKCDFEVLFKGENSPLD